MQTSLSIVKLYPYKYVTFEYIDESTSTFIQSSHCILYNWLRTFDWQSAVSFSLLFAIEIAQMYTHSLEPFINKLMSENKVVSCTTEQFIWR